MTLRNKTFVYKAIELYVQIKEKNNKGYNQLFIF